jgi:hypothetical protein
MNYSPMTPSSSHGGSSPYHPNSTPTRNTAADAAVDLQLLAHHEWYSPDIEVLTYLLFVLAGCS